MKRYLIVAFSVITMSLLVGCKPAAETRKDNTTLIIKPMFNSSEMALNTNYTNHLGQKLNFSTIKMYLTNIRLVKDDNSEVVLKDLALINLADANSLKIIGTIAGGNYKAIKFGVGLSPAQNDTDPSTITDESNPLHNNNEMYWSSSLKYVFSRIEGKADTTSNGSGVQNWYLLYHVGQQAQYREVTITQPIAIDLNANTLTVEADYGQFFDGASALNIIAEKSTHSFGSELPLAVKIADIYTTIFSLK